MADNSAVAKMARLVEEAQNSRSSTQRLIDTCAKYYTPGNPDRGDYACSKNSVTDNFLDRMVLLTVIFGCTSQLLFSCLQQ